MAGVQKGNTHSGGANVNVSQVSKEQVVTNLKNGNQKFLERFGSQLIAAYESRKPVGIIIACSDSRVGPGKTSELEPKEEERPFIILRVAGNYLSKSVITSIAELTEVKGFGKLPVYIQKHSCCGAVTAAVKAAKTGVGGEPDNIIKLLGEVNPCVKGDDINASIDENAKLQMEQAAHLGEVRLVHYDVATGKLTAVQNVSEDDPLIKGNEKFVGDEQNLQVVRQWTETQKPWAVVVSDANILVSREQLFGRNVGEIFEISVTANALADASVLGSIEYGTEHCPAKVVVVLGKNAEDVAIREKEILEGSTSVKGKVDSGKLHIVRAVYKGAGKVEFLESA